MREVSAARPFIESVLRAKVVALAAVKLRPEERIISIRSVAAAVGHDPRIRKKSQLNRAKSLHGTSIGFIAPPVSAPSARATSAVKYCKPNSRFGERSTKTSLPCSRLRGECASTALPDPARVQLRSDQVSRSQGFQSAPGASLNPGVNRSIAAPAQLCGDSKRARHHIARIRQLLHARAEDPVWIVHRRPAEIRYIRGQQR
jgi:hypothetical protein